MLTIETRASAALNGSVELYASEVGRLFCGLTFAVTGFRSLSFGDPLSVRRLDSIVIVSSASKGARFDSCSIYEYCTSNTLFFIRIYVYYVDN